MKYNRTEAALRIRNRRKTLGLTSAEVAEKIGRADHYYGDIERGTCGMSIDTLVELTRTLELSADYILFGAENENGNSNAAKAYRILRKYDEQRQEHAVELMKYYLNLEER